MKYCGGEMREKLREDKRHLLEYAASIVKPAKQEIEG